MNKFSTKQFGLTNSILKGSINSTARLDFDNLIFGEVLKSSSQPRVDWELGDEQMEAISKAMTSSWNPNDIDPEAPKAGALDAGLTYLGQLVTHDIVKSTTLRDERNVTPYLNLDGIYPSLLSARINVFLDDEGRFNLGSSTKKKALDLLRAVDGQAAIVEKRNDENIILSQLLVIWLEFHNKAIDFCIKERPNESRENKYNWAKAFVTLVFHRVVVEQLLCEIMDPNLYKYYFEKKTGVYNPLVFEYRKGKTFVIPLEFSHAAFRHGHSMIRQSYILNIDNGTSFQIQKLFRSGRVLEDEKKIYWPLFFTHKDQELPPSDRLEVKKRFNRASIIGLSIAGGTTIVPENTSLLGRLLQKLKKIFFPCEYWSLIVIWKRVVNLVVRDIKASSLLPTLNEILVALHKTNHQSVPKFNLDLPGTYANNICFSGSLLAGPDRIFQGGKKSELNASNAPLWIAMLREAEVYPRTTSSVGFEIIHQKMGPIASIVLGETLRRSIAGSPINMLDDDDLKISKSLGPLFNLYAERFRNSKEPASMTKLLTFNF